MENITHFDSLTEYLSKGSKKRIAVVCGEDAHTSEAVLRAVEQGFVEAIFVGTAEAQNANKNLQPSEGRVRLATRETPDECAAEAVSLVRCGVADVLMKGLINTDNLLRAVLNKETGILPKGKLLTHIAAAELPDYSKLLFFTDAAVLPSPTQEQREQQVAYIAELCRRFGIDEPRISLIHCSEKVDERHFPHTGGYATIIDKAKDGEFGKCIVDGPLDVKTSLSAESLRTKGIKSPLEGMADALVFPEIESANTFYKTITLFGHARTAAILQGAAAPVVLTSRADSVESKFFSLALACIAG